MHRDESRAGARQAAAEHVLVDLCRKNPELLSENDRIALLLPLKTSNSLIGRIWGFVPSVVRLGRMHIEHPAPTLRALWQVKFQFGTRRHTLLPMIFERHALKAQTLRTENGKQTIS
jgi:hypothetical protein